MTPLERYNVFQIIGPLHGDCTIISCRACPARAIREEKQKEFCAELWGYTQGTPLSYNAAMQRKIEWFKKTFLWEQEDI